MNNSENEIRISRKAFAVTFVLLNLYPLYQSLVASARIQQIIKLDVEMLGSSELPLVTRLVFLSHRWLWLLPVVCIALAIGCACQRNASPRFATLVAVASFVVAFGLHAFLLEGFMQPLFMIIGALGG